MAAVSQPIVVRPSKEASFGEPPPKRKLEWQAPPIREGSLTTEYQGKAYYFCTEACKAKFEANPEKYAKEMVRAEASR